MSRKPSEVFLKNGRSLADCMPGKLEGAVVGGKPDTSLKPFNVVNADGALIAQLSPDDLCGDIYDFVMEQAKELIPGSDIESVRERAAYVFEQVAKLKTEQTQRPTSPPPIQQQDYDEAYELAAEIIKDVAVVKEAKQSTPHVDRDYSPMAAFGFKSKSNMTAAKFSNSIAVSPDIGPPQKLVYFEKEGIGTVPAFFHEVVSALEPIDEDGLEKSGFLVLIYDLRYSQNTARWFPPAYDPYGRPWAVKINDDAYVYLVKTTGFQYVYDNREHCILSVERAVFSAGD